MGADVTPEAMPDPRKDRICQRSLCGLFGFSERTGSLLAKSGKLRRFEHGIPGSGRRKYSRALVERELQMRWSRAVKTQDELMAGGLV